MSRTERANSPKKPNNAMALMVIMLFMVALVVFALSRPTNTVQANKDKQYEEVMELDLAAEYPDSPDKVLDSYNQIDSFLSGNTVDKFTDGDLRTLVEKQRLLLHPELLEQNTLDSHIKGYADKIALCKKDEMRIMQVDAETPRFGGDGKTCSIGVRQYWNVVVNGDKRHINLVYNLKKDEESEKWKIIGWYVNEQEES